MLFLLLVVEHFRNALVCLGVRRGRSFHYGRHYRLFNYDRRCAHTQSTSNSPPAPAMTICRPSRKIMGSKRSNPVVTAPGVAPYLAFTLPAESGPSLICSVKVPATGQLRP